MYITFTYRCPECGHEEDRFVKKSEMDSQTHCGVPMVRLPPATRTTFRFADTKLKE